MAVAMADQNFRILNPLADGIALVNAAERHLRGDDDGASHHHQVHQFDEINPEQIPS